MVAKELFFCQNMSMNSFEGALDDRAESFLQIGDVTRTIAEIHCGVEVDQTTHERWRHVAGLLREIDTLADDTDTSDADVVQRLDDFSEFEGRYPSLAPDVLGKETHSLMLDRTERILKIGHHVSQATSMSRFIALRIIEGRQTAAFLDDAATPAVRNQPNFHDRFMPAMESLAVTANLLDSITDAKMDYKEGKIAHEPDAEFKKALLSQIRPHARLGGQALLHGSVMSQFGVMSWNRLVNRVKHRQSSTTSLQIFRGK